MNKLFTHILLLALLGSALLSGCAPTTAADAGVRVVATTTIVGDVAAAVGGERIALTVLLPRGADPHAYAPTPQDLAAVADADLVLINGAGLEEGFLERLLQNTGDDTPVVAVSDGVRLRTLGDGANPDPHVWFDPANVIIWTWHIAHALSEADPDGAAVYEENAAAYEAKLQELDGWIQEQVARVPAENRELVTGHIAFGYFAARYGFEQVGAVFPGFSTLGEPSAQERAALEEAIRAQGVNAVFVGTTVNPALAEQIAADTGIQVVPLYTGSLSEPGGEADSYLALMRYDVTVIVDALR